MKLFKKNQITFFGLLNYFTNLQWVDRNEFIKGGKINDLDNWKLKSESFYNKMQLENNKDKTTIKLQKNEVSKLLSKYNQVQKYKLQIKEENKQMIRFNIIHEIKQQKYMELLKIIQSEQNYRRQNINNNFWRSILEEEIKNKQSQIMKETIQQRSLNFDEEFIYLWLKSTDKDKDSNYGSLRISFQVTTLQKDQNINFVAVSMYDENNKIETYKAYDDFYFDVIIGQKLTKEEYFHQLYWRKNSKRILIFLQMGVLFTLGIIIGVFAFKVVVEDNPLLNSVCRAHNLLMGFVLIYNTVWLIIAITEVNFMINCYWNLISRKQIFLLCLLIVTLLCIIIGLIESKQSHDDWKELNMASNGESLQTQSPTLQEQLKIRLK